MMDKLELDVRLARLERRVAMLMLAIPIAVAVPIALALVSTRSVETASYVPATVTTAIEVPTPPRAFAAVDMTEGSVGLLASRLRDLEDLKRRSLISSSECDSKKAQLFEKPLNSTDLKADLEQLFELQRKNVITSSEYDRLKSKILNPEP